MIKGKAYVPFRIELSPIKEMAMFHFHKNPDTEYDTFELHYIEGESYGSGFRVLAWRKDGYRDSYVQDSLTISEEDEILSVGGKGLKERYIVKFDEAYFNHVDGRLDAGFVFNDKLDRRIVLYVDERIEKESNPLTWLPSVGNHLEEPHSMPLFFLYDFDFARKRDTDIFLSIDGNVKEVDPFAFPKDFQSRYYVEFSTNSVVANFNKAGKYELEQVEIDEQGIAKTASHTYLYEKINDLYKLKRMTLEHETHPVEVSFSPSFPNHREVAEAKPFYGEFVIRPSGEAGFLKGKYNVLYQQGKAIINLTFPESWNTPKGANYERIINSMTPNIKSWYQTYQCRQVVQLEGMDTFIEWTRVNPDRRS
ncbi:hypothetical protein [Alkalibacterium sp. 20]|uniref:hypothetical protein n=1 Tax=Alkalibacterium sp. 20 TaxID=1798803 RepID=UPI0009004FA9|nr:hypothetical protein [Alkalibacterium sp. 20]OJF97099.1 hypothetical protein AX762_00755 [Alkalibacterium sp. 20]